MPLPEAKFLMVKVAAFSPWKMVSEPSLLTTPRQELSAVS
jgi:hypothetical protein